MTISSQTFWSPAIPGRFTLPEINSSAQAIGQRLAEIRRSRSLTQIQLAEKIGINQYQISDYETGRLHLSDEMIIRLAQALSTSADSILGLNEVSTESPSLKLMKRLQKIENLPPNQQKVLLKNIDMFLKAAESGN
jgi:transcriptional regulator with XRE-family HTH domain